MHRSSKRLLPLIGLACVLLGIGLAQIRQPAIANPTTGTVDPVPERLQLGQQLYLQTCSTCHIAVPPAVLPVQSWAEIFQTPRHYGTQIELPRDPTRLLIWNYVRTFARGVAPNEQPPLQLERSRFFRALHPKVDFADPISVGSCISCHPSATDFNFRQLAAEWETAP